MVTRYDWAASHTDLVIVLELLHSKMEVTVSEPCDVIRVEDGEIRLEIRAVTIWGALNIQRGRYTAVCKAEAGNKS